jgi:hypothetical protein
MGYRAAPTGLAKSPISEAAGHGHQDRFRVGQDARSR